MRGWRQPAEGLSVGPSNDLVTRGNYEVTSSTQFHGIPLFVETVHCELQSTCLEGRAESCTWVLTFPFGSPYTPQGGTAWVVGTYRKVAFAHKKGGEAAEAVSPPLRGKDRKSTRLNSSH